MARIVAALRQCGIDVEHHDAAGALAMGVRDAVHPGVSAPDDDHLLVPGGDLGSGLRRARGPALLSSDPAVALVEVVHREVDPPQLAPGRVEVAGDARADRDHDRIESLLELAARDVAADVGVVDELDALLLEEVDPAVDDPLLELGVRHPEAQEPPGALVALVHGHRVAALVQLGGGGQAGRARAHDGHGPPGAPVRRLGLDPALGEGPLDDRQLDLLDRHRIVVDRQHARRFARGRTDEAGELGEVVGRVELIDGLAPLVPVDEVVPVGDQVPERTALVAERNAAVHAAGALTLKLGRGLQREVLVVVADTLAGIALIEADPMDLQKRA